MIENNILNNLIGNTFLFITTTDVEAEALFEIMTPIPNSKKIVKVAIDNHTYYVGKVGLYPVVHVQCNSMGMINPGASITTTYDAITQWKPIAVIIIGIAFGMDKGKQRIGDVLISNSIIDYECAKISSKGKEYRNHNVIAGTILFDRFKNMRTWDFELPRNKKAKPIFGTILSGEKLIDNPDFLNEIKSSFPLTIGGEMESYGVFSACKNAGISEWIMIKGICDWANGNKSVQKQTRQELAARSAASFCLSVFSENVFECLCKTIYKIDNKIHSYDYNQPRLPVVFLLDTSGSMAGQKIAALSSALVSFKKDLLSENITCAIDVSIVTFSTYVEIVQNFTSIDKMQIPQLKAEGVTNMGEAISVAIDMVNKYINTLKMQERPFYKPFIILITDGQASDNINHSIVLTNQYAQKFNFLFFGVDGADYEQLLKFTNNVIKVIDCSFKELFQWVSSFISLTSNSCGKEKIELISLPDELKIVGKFKF